MHGRRATPHSASAIGRVYCDRPATDRLRWRPAVAMLPDSSRHLGVVVVDTWRSRLVVGSDAREVIAMSFATLAVISLVAIVGPLLAWPRRWHLPIILGELAAGIVLGATGSGRLQADNETFTCVDHAGRVLLRTRGRGRR